ncbi:ABC transporter permease [Ktedonospora formicarum]|uniref:Uncharacterized protein n=1 Tax=Ktedonospora formicarum TaxID=2778364 RepID=A0A8J3I6N1_9CHLR|nr:ABC transporter permease [Ktedonospora formicarum]GHO47835.1 hypothetical protein KSX_59980 [Ktedonospora formicarum]
MMPISLLVPKPGPRATLGQLWATIAAEILMQWRRWGFWLAFPLAGSLVALIYIQNAIDMQNNGVLLTQRFALDMAGIVNLFTFLNTYYSTVLYALIASLLVADRLPRDRQLGMLELQRAAPFGHGVYVLGKFLGNYIAILVPAFLSYLICGSILVWLGLSTDIFCKLALAFTLVFLPASAVTVALTLLCSSLFPLRVVQIGFPLLWLDATISLFDWPTISRTIFNPAGRYVYPVFFPTSSVGKAISDHPLVMAQLNIVILWLTASISLIVLYISLHYQARRSAGN